MILKTSPIVLGLALFSVTAIAELKAVRDLSIGRQKVRVEINEVKSDTSDKPLTKVQTEPFIKVISDVSEMVQPLKIPTIVRLNLAQLTFEPSASALINTLELGVRIAKRDEKNRVHTQNPSVMRAITAHEYGHLIFAQNILATQNIRSELERYGREAGEMEGKLKQIRDEIDKLDALAATKGMTVDLQAKIEKLDQQFQAGLARLQNTQEKHNDLMERYERTTSYNEFFADVVSLLYTENPNAIAEAIHFTVPRTSRRNDSDRRGEILSREFEAGKPHRHTTKSPHAVFAQVRAALWENYLKQPTVMKKKSVVLGCTTQAVESEVRWILEKRRIPDDRRVVRLLNERLWKQLDQCLSR